MNILLVKYLYYQTKDYYCSLNVILYYIFVVEIYQHNCLTMCYQCSNFVKYTVKINKNCFLTL